MPADLRLDPAWIPVLQGTVLFRDLDEQGRKDALSFFGASVRRYARGDQVHALGTPFHSFGLILSGSVQVYMDELDGRQMLMAHVDSGGTFGEALCFLQIPASPVYVRTAERTEILWLSLDKVRAGGEDAGAKLFRNRFSAMMAEKMLNMNDRIQILSKSSLRERLITFFTQCIHRSGSNTFSVPFDRNGMAAYLCVNRSAVSRELARMKQDGLIDYYKNSFRILKEL